MGIKYNENEQYWKDRKLLSQNMGEKTAGTLLNTMRKVYLKSVQEIDAEISRFYMRYATENKLTLADVYKRLDPKQLRSANEEIKAYYDFADPSKIGKNMSKQYREKLRLMSARAYMSRLEEEKMRLENIMVHLGAEEAKAFDKELAKIYESAYETGSFDIDKAMGFTTGYSAPSMETINQIVHERWSGYNYSDRIWTQKGHLLDSIEKELLSGIAQGHNPRKIAEAIHKRYDTAYSNCERLARTETIHTMNRATEETYRDHGIEKYQFLCDLSERTCPVCGGLDGKVFELKYKLEGVNYPVMHPNCRCTTIPYFEKDAIDKMFEESKRLAYDEDRNIYMVPSDMTWAEWKNKKYLKNVA